MRQRRGVALLSVVLIAMLVICAIAVTSSSVIAERSITTSELGFKQALPVAESGLSATTGDLRAAVWQTTDSGSIGDTSEPYLTPAEVLQIAKDGVGGIVDCGTRQFPNPRGIYDVKVKKLSGAPWDGQSNYNTHVTVALYALGEVYGNDARSYLLGRRVLYRTADISFNLTYTPAVGATGPTTVTTPPMPGSTTAFGYGLFSGGSINFQGSPHAVMTNGDIYARGNIDLGGKDRLDPGKVVYSLGTVTGAKSTDTVKDSGSPKNPNGTPAVPDIPFPALSVAFYDQMANDFKTGSGYYSGSPVKDSSGNVLNTGYPKTTPYATILQGYLGVPGVSATLSGIQSLYTDLKAGTGAWASVSPADRTAFLAQLKYGVYHVIGGGTIAGTYSALGAIVVSGPYDAGTKTWTTTTLHLSGQSNVVDLGGLAILVNGDIVGTGQASLQGLFYASGTFNNGSGQFTCNGAIVSGGSMQLSGQITVNYQAIANMPDIGITGTPGSTVTTSGTPGSPATLEGNVQSVTYGTDTWEERNKNAFDTAN